MFPLYLLHSREMSPSLSSLATLLKHSSQAAIMVNPLCSLFPLQYHPILPVVWKPELHAVL